MRTRMEAGGYRLLLRYLLDYDLSRVDINQAPATSALMDQKVASLDPFPQWWLDCLTEGALTGSDFGNMWPRDVDKERFRAAFRRYAQSRRITSRLPEDRVLGKQLAEMCPSVDARQKRRDGAETLPIYRLPGLEQARAEWAKFIGFDVVWD